MLREAAAWLVARGETLWREGELAADRIADEVAAGAYGVAVADREVVGTIRFELDDDVFWPDAPRADAGYVHRLAVRRSHAGGTVSTALLDWAADRARAARRRVLRLDCETSRPRLRAFYERYGFRFHSERQVGPYRVARYELDVAND